MPIYEYRCKDCGEHFEKRQSVSEEPLKTCEKCSGTLEKQWSLSGFQFKGGGWYVTDYAGKTAKAVDGKNEKASGGESTDKSADASKPKSDPGPAAKSDSESTKK
jgi:putative FmdB family regulatory protein